MPASGGAPEQVIKVETGEQTHGPHRLPDGEWILFTLLPAGKMFVAQLGESLLDAAARAGIRLPHQCKTGSCGACRAQVLHGPVQDIAGALPSALTAEDLAQGQRLLCCSAAAGDLQLECAEIPHIPGIDVRKLPVRVAAMERLAPDVMRSSVLAVSSSILALFDASFPPRK